MTTTGQSVLVAAIDSSDRQVDVIAALTAAMDNAQLVHTVGGPHGVSPELVLDNPGEALTHIVGNVNKLPAGNYIYTGTDNLDFDARIAAVLGSAVVLTLSGAACVSEAALVRARVAIAQVQRRFATVAGVLVTGDVAGELPDLGVPVVKLDDELGDLVSTDVEPVMTPQRFEAELLAKAKLNKRNIVLPEGEDDRILEAAHRLLAEDICDITILGDVEDIKARAEKLGFDLSKAQMFNPETSELAEEFAADFAELRKHKGVTLDDARATMKDISYFATMMIHKGKADGMVSGAAHTTAHTIKPSFQIIKTQPGVSAVSSIFMMVMENRLWAFGDCAVSPNPTAQQLGEAAVVSAKTAAQFGIDPRVAMLSYSTGASGTGPDVEKVAAALSRARGLDPNLPVDGPLQFDAAVDPATGKRKMPESKVAGNANVFIFPDLDAGNIGYKIAQRTGGALAVGPILQGLNKPVNDLSRGATVDDIVNTVAITAIQAGGK